MDSDDVLDGLAAIAQRSRLGIVRLLAAHPDGLDVGGIVSLLQLTQSNASMQLSVLARARLVEGETRGRHTVYRLARIRLDEIGRALSDLALGVPE